jgi:hypothetical protein
MKNDNWQYLLNQDIGVNPLFVKCHTIFNDMFFLFGKGVIPREPSGVCSSFILVFKCKKENGKIVHIDPDYTYVKISNFINPGYIVQPNCRMSPDGNYLRFTFVNDIAECGTWEYTPTTVMLDVPLNKLGDKDIDLIDMEKKQGLELMKIVELSLDINYY